MLSHSRVTAVLPVLDLARARHFYEETLGLPPAEPWPGQSALYRIGGTRLELEVHDDPWRHANHTAASFEVDDIQREVGDLEGRGVVFEDYDLPELRTVGHVAQVGSLRTAWFKDSEGNVLSIYQDDGAARSARP